MRTYHALKCDRFERNSFFLGGAGGGGGLTSSITKSSANISGEESSLKHSIPGYLFFDNTQKTALKSKLPLVIVLVFESKG